MKYTVENTTTEKITTHSTWGGAMREAAKHPQEQVIIIEKDRDGERTYNALGQVMSRDGHWVS